jgi:hypothetical protein
MGCPVVGPRSSASTSASQAGSARVEVVLSCVYSPGRMRGAGGDDVPAGSFHIDVVADAFQQRGAADPVTVRHEVELPAAADPARAHGVRAGDGFPWLLASRWKSPRVSSSMTTRPAFSHSMPAAG